MARQGPEDATGRFASREELVHYIYSAYEATEVTRKQLAEDCGVSVGTLQNILKQKNQLVRDDGFEQAKKTALTRQWRVGAI
jgi:hypothetical protein